MTNEDINNYLRLAIMEEVNKRMGKNFECIYDLCDYAKNLEKENEQLKADIIEIEKVSDYRFEENEQLKAKIKILEEKNFEKCLYRRTDMGCDYCDWKDRDLKYEVEE